MPFATERKNEDVLFQEKCEFIGSRTTDITKTERLTFG